MSEYIECRRCDSPNCKGCNINTLATMLRMGTFDGLMNGNRSINPAADVKPVIRSEWEITDVDHGNGHKCFHCPECGEDEWRDDKPNYCPNCGAKMDGE